METDRRPNMKKKEKKAWKQTILRDLNIVVCSKKAVNV